MGCFGYMCSSCNQQIVGKYDKGGEQCVLIHKRHGVEIGRAVGHYNEYGGVIENELFRSLEDTHPNSHEEICDSEMSLEDSLSFDGRKYVNGRSMEMTSLKYIYLDKVVAAMRTKQMKEMGSFKSTTEFPKDIMPDDVLERWNEDNHEEGYKKFVDSLEDVEIKSGIIACHKVCYDKLSSSEQEKLSFSETDPNQSWGLVKQEFA